MSSTTTQPTFAEIAATVTCDRIGPLQARALKDDPSAVAALARLRRAVGKPPGSLSDVLEYTMDERLPWNRQDDTVASPAELAVHVALTLYATHQQSRRERMHVQGPTMGLGRSARLLLDRIPADRPDPVVRRFQLLGTSVSWEELNHHLRGIIGHLRAHTIPLDYGQLAADLVRWQYPGGPDRVRVRWGREFFALPRRDQKQKTDQTTPEQKD